MNREESLGILETVFDLIANFTRILPSLEDAEKMKTMEFYALMYVGMKGPKKMIDLSKTLSTTKSNVTVLVDGLERKGYFERIRTDEDRRVVLVALTKKGSDVYRKTIENIILLVDRVIEKIPEDDLGTISDGFQRMSNALLNEDEP